MKTRMQKTLYNENLHLFGSLTLLLLLSALYVYFLSSTVVQVVMQKEVRSQISDLNAEISNLEAEYIERQHAVSDEIASLQGFVRTGEKIFIDKSKTSLVLSTNGF